MRSRARRWTSSGVGRSLSLITPSAAKVISFFFFNVTATTEFYTLLYTLSLHDALPISPGGPGLHRHVRRFLHRPGRSVRRGQGAGRSEEHTSELQSHSNISYAVFC